MLCCHEGMKHCRGILLFGPPGTGKTLMARQIGNMLNAREPKIVNGPQVLDKYVGESEANIRKLFAEAEEEEKRVRSSLLCFSLYIFIYYILPTVAFIGVYSIQTPPVLALWCPLKYTILCALLVFIR